MKYRILIALTVVFTLYSCDKNDHKIEFTFLQVNDVYEIGALEDGEVGGLDRVETLHKKLLKENPNTFLFMAGDFLNPSLLGNIKYLGERVKGKQMIEVMNAMNFDLVNFGNHEFDLSADLLQERIDSSNFTWIATNLRFLKDNTERLFYKNSNGIKNDLPKTVIFNLKDKDGTEIKIGFFSGTINSNPREYVKYTDFYEEAKNAYNRIKNKTDIVFGFTHLKISQDKMIAKMLPYVPLIMGGHEHSNMNIKVGNAVITKADANAKTAYVHKFVYDTKTKILERKSELVKINSKIIPDSLVSNIISKWQTILDASISKFADNVHEVIYHAEIPLDGEDRSNRSKQTNLGEIITKSMAFAYNNKVDGALVNGGSMRLDDLLEGSITGVDIFRVLPFGGSVVKVKIKGDLLVKVLNYGRIKKGEGAYLQRINFTYNKEKKEWYCSGKKILKNKIYTIAFSDYLLKGYDIPFLKPDNKGVVEVYHPKKDELAHDIRSAIIAYLKTLN